MIDMKLNAKDVAEAIDIPIEQWPGNCYAIASAMVNKGVVSGRVVYGHYHGPISDSCEIFGGRPFTHHGWVQDGDVIIDPTRWVFENREPYVYTCYTNNTNYDPGSNMLRKMLMREPPKFVPTQQTFSVPDRFLCLICEYFGPIGNELCAQQVAWLASLPLDMMFGLERPLLRWIAEDLKQPGFIPIDNRMTILGKS